MLDLGPRMRGVFAAIWIASQTALVVTATHRSDHAFGFQMFGESSTLEVHLVRVLDGAEGLGTRRVDVEGGSWIARDSAGNPHRIKWRERVHEPALAIFDAVFHASYGADAQLARWRAALDDVALHTPDDAETRALELTIAVRRNGRSPETITMTSARR